MLLPRIDALYKHIGTRLSDLLRRRRRLAEVGCPISRTQPVTRLIDREPPSLFVFVTEQTCRDAVLNAPRRIIYRRAPLLPEVQLDYFMRMCCFSCKLNLLEQRGRISLLRHISSDSIMSCLDGRDPRVSTWLQQLCSSNMMRYRKGEGSSANLGAVVSEEEQQGLLERAAYARTPEASRMTGAWFTSPCCCATRGCGRAMRGVLVAVSCIFTSCAAPMSPASAGCTWGRQAAFLRPRIAKQWSPWHLAAKAPCGAFALRARVCDMVSDDGSKGERKLGRIINQKPQRQQKHEQLGASPRGGGGDSFSAEGQGGNGSLSSVVSSIWRSEAVLLGVSAVAVVAALLIKQPGNLELLHDFDFKALFSKVETTVSDLGPMGYVLFAAVYVAAEVLAVPALPLTASAGYLFGLVPGTAVVAVSATIAAALSFVIGRTLLRSTVEKWMDDHPRFKALDAAIGSEGFKIILLLRLSPIFPFAISNYLYGVTAVPFWPYLGATFLGFLPGTIAYVYSGQLGRTLTDGSLMSRMPWYVYVGFAGVLIVFGKIVADIANRAIAEYETTQDDKKL